MIETVNLNFEYKDEKKVLKNINLRVKKGFFTVILGKNGSGKSTLARHFNALLEPTEGTVYVGGIDTRDKERLFEIRSNVGMVFQNPDNQIVSVTVEDEAAFAPENLGVMPRQIRRRVDECLKAVGLLDYAKSEAAYLSGGQKQRLAIAAALTMNPKCIVFDESTSMLDPRGRKEFMEIVRALNKEQGLTVVLITHYMEEAVLADRTIVLDDGKIVLDGSPKDVFRNVELIKKIGLEVPQSAELAYDLRQSGIDFPDVIDIEECADALEALLGGTQNDRN